MNFLSTDPTLLAIGFIFTFFIPGFLVIETFFRELFLLQKIPLYMLISVLVSTYTVYIFSLLIGFSRSSILLSFLLFLLWFLIFFIRKSIKFKINLSIIKEHAPALLSSVLIFILFLVALYPAIFYPYQNYFVMSAVNWQDTAMHQSIIESISQGNFPPQSPYFSGYPLNYYYFIDLHAAILQTLYNNFSPRILVFDNPFFALIFFLSMYALSLSFFKSKVVGVIASILALFVGNFLYIKFFQDVYISLGSSNNFLISVRNIIANHGYTMEYGHLMQMVPMADYFLQNRPMMVGLPAVALVILLIKNGFERNKTKYFVISGLLTAMLIKFQLFAFLVLIIIYSMFWLIFSKGNLKDRLKKIMPLFAPLVISIFFVSLLTGSNNYALEAFLDNFRFGVWDQSKNLSWYLLFPFANFGIPFLLFLLILAMIIFQKIILSREIVFLIFLGLILYIIPHLVFFTIYDGDMLKFFYFALIPLSLLSGWLLTKYWYSFHLSITIVVLLIAASSFNSFLTLGWSFFNKNQGYSNTEYQAGMWIRNNTLPNAVFLSMPTVHSAISDIGGRLRVLSYMVWPYSHGFNKGMDNVFSRQSDIESLYRFPNDLINFNRVIKRYNISYIYVGLEENSKFPLLKDQFQQNPNLDSVYSSKEVQIYKVQ